jgi:hypothetical protein
MNDNPSDFTSWIEPLVQLATAGGFGALVWYLVVKHIPSIEERHQSERGEWLQYIQRRDDDFDEMYFICVKYRTYKKCIHYIAKNASIARRFVS